MVYAIIAASVILVAAFVIGLVRGFIKSGSWATEYLFAVIFSVLIFTFADLSGMNEWIASALKVGVTAAILLLFAFLSSRAKAFLKKCVASAQKRSYYEQYGDREENTLQILDAIETGDAKEYRRLTKRKFKEKRGVAGVLDRIFGGITQVIKAAVILWLVAAFVLVVLDFTQIPSIVGYLDGVYSSGVWEFFSQIVMDVFVIGIMFVALRRGYRSGVFSALWSLFVIALIAGAAVLSYWLCFNVEAFISTAQGLNGSISGFTQAIADGASLAGLDITSQQVAQGVLTGIIFVVLFIVVIIVGVVVSGAISRAREGKAVAVVDGVLGAAVLFVLVTVIMLFAGAVLFTLEDVPAMEIFNTYMYNGEKYAAIASVFYGENPLSNYSFISELPIRGWFSG